MANYENITPAQVKEKLDRGVTREYVHPSPPRAEERAGERRHL